jgi:hypothetical protein
MSNLKTQMLQGQNLTVWFLDFDIHLNFETLAFDIMSCQSKILLYGLRLEWTTDSGWLHKN